MAALDSGQRRPRAVSPRFADPASSAQAEGTVYAFKTVKTAQQYLAPFEATSGATCFRDGFTKAVGSQNQVTITPITDLQGVGDHAFGYQASETGTDQNGKAVHVVADLVDVRVGRAVVTFMFGNSDVRIPQGVAIVQSVVTRLTSTVGG